MRLGEVEEVEEAREAQEETGVDQLDFRWGLLLPGDGGRR
jgi:hypothetical protein